jgi:hypothetical protein
LEDGINTKFRNVHRRFGAGEDGFQGDGDCASVYVEVVNMSPYGDVLNGLMLRFVEVLKYKLFLTRIFSMVTHRLMKFVPQVAAFP